MKVFYSFRQQFLLSQKVQYFYSLAEDVPISRYVLVKNQCAYPKTLDSKSLKFSFINFLLLKFVYLCYQTKRINIQEYLTLG